MSNWKKCKLGEIVTLNYGKSLTSHKREEGKIPVYSSSGISGKHNVALQECPAVIVGRKGNVGSVFYTEKPFYCIDTAYYILPNEKYNLKFLYYLLRTVGLDQLNEDSAVPGLNRNTAYAQYVALPDLPTQTRIASILSSLDDKIELNHRTNQTLEQMAQALFKKYFVYGIDVENLPDGWVYKKLCEVVEITSSKRIFLNDYVTSGIPFYRGKEIIELYKGNNISTELFITEKKFEEIKKKFGVPKVGDILLTSVGTIGIPYLVLNDKEFYFKDGNLTWFRKYFDFVGPYYLYQWLISEGGQYSIKNITIGSTQQAITIQSLKALNIIIPPKELHDIFSDQLTAIRKKISNNINETAILSSLRDSLLLKLMNGEIELN